MKIKHSNTSVFLSHNFSDKAFVRRLARNLVKHGIHCWIDEAEIRIGDSLISKIQDGIMGSEYLAVVLSPHSVRSAWVKKELEMAFSIEVNNKKVKILPLLVQDCEIPPFLKDKLYADFRNSYRNGLNALLSRFIPKTIYPKPDAQKVNRAILNVSAWASFINEDAKVIYKKTLSLDTTIAEVRRINPEKGGFLWVNVEFADIKLFEHFTLFCYNRTSGIRLTYNYNVDALVPKASSEDKKWEKIAEQMEYEIWARDKKIMSIFGLNELAVNWGGPEPSPVSVDSEVNYYIDNDEAWLYVQIKSKSRAAYDSMSLKSVRANAKSMSTQVQEVLRSIKRNRYS